MFPLPDVSTVRLCSLLLSFAFMAVFLALWRGRREDVHLLLWGASSAVYAGVLLAFEIFTDRLPPWPGGLIFLALVASNLLLLVGVRVFDGRAPFAPWMLALLALGLLGYAGPFWLAATGLPLPLPATARVGSTVALMVCVGVVGALLLRGGPRERPAPPGQGVPRGHHEAGRDAGRGRRIAGLAMLGYVPGYLVAIGLELGGPWGFNLAALLPMLSDQLLLAILYLGLLSMPGERAQHTLREAALRDPLTGAWNRAGLEARRAAIAAGGAALILLDIDHFKTINDRHGHAAGDAVLVSFAARMAALAAEQSGWLVRLGGDEFVVVLPQAAAETAARLAQRLREAAASSGHAAGGNNGLPHYTISLGLSTIGAGADAPGRDALGAALARADHLLYRAKAQGRNRLAL